MLQTFTPIIVNAPQRSEKWYTARLGNLTASNAKKAMAFSKPTVAELALAYKVHLETYQHELGQDWLDYIEEMSTKYPVKFCLDAGIELKELEERKKHREELVGERLTGLRADPDGYVNNDMKWGIVNEFHAYEMYQQEYNVKVTEAPLMLHPTLMCGASLDRLVIDLETGELGCSESKCPRSANHLYKAIKTEEMPEEHFPQVQFQMWIAQRDWNDFLSFDSRVKEGLMMMKDRIPKDEWYLANVMIPMVTDFLLECDHDERVFHAIRKANLERRAKKEAEELERKELREQ